MSYNYGPTRTQLEYEYGTSVPSAIESIVKQRDEEEQTRQQMRLSLFNAQLKKDMTPQSAEQQLLDPSSDAYEQVPAFPMAPQKISLGLGSGALSPAADEQIEVMPTRDQLRPDVAEKISLFTKRGSNALTPEEFATRQKVETDENVRQIREGAKLGLDRDRFRQFGKKVLAKYKARMDSAEGILDPAQFDGILDEVYNEGNTQPAATPAAPPAGNPSSNPVARVTPGPASGPTLQEFSIKYKAKNPAATPEEIAAEFKRRGGAG